jgi:hypothetical protein
MQPDLWRGCPLGSRAFIFPMSILYRRKRDMTTNITPDHRAAFEALTSGDYANFALFSCFVNGEPAAAIVAVNRGDDSYFIKPLFVSVTPSITLTDHDWKPASGAPP